MSSPGSEFELIIRQQPAQARMAGGRERERRPVDPPPVVQVRLGKSLRWHTSAINELDWYFSIVTSRAEDEDNNKMDLFVFGDLSVKVEGDFRLKFTLFEMGKGAAIHLQSIISDRFTVFRPKSFPGMAESTPLSKSLVDQGLKLRLRKKPRSLIKRQVPLRLEHYRQPAPRSQGHASLQIPGDIFKSHPAAVTAGSHEYSHYTGLVKRSCLAPDFINPGMHNDGQTYELEAHPQTAALHENQPRAYPTQGGPASRAVVPDYQMLSRVPALDRIQQNL
ncbi:hypothetical protein ANOM_005894 [Aspergillus nomiae NRRL 13137]|uniref:Velvet domain-containing protein n=1 Tax=Aspergillus nomiae NRRL (strain ATCC 15546 / NRRL 13137 / CBS 260.88 / M93) TaxID=1509407 RepID=A0A0L1J4R9_ASPN3|nr:uncharacterized protein ANOM_005894 [Aspergillus nomiae NRRL 13137]KNG86739.1 hypothetical protein ANOM_005894 [Aspergillus nomiae NRRL 13137]